MQFQFFKYMLNSQLIEEQNWCSEELREPVHDDYAFTAYRSCLAQNTRQAYNLLSQLFNVNIA